MSGQVDNIINKMNSEDAAIASEWQESNNGYQKFYCDAKNQEQLNEFIDDMRPKLVALVGFAGFGKSTFIGSLYHLLTSNLSYKGYSLVDSDTYVGFERRVFLRRLNSDDISDTKRTLLGENDILHLALRSGEGLYYDILVSDKSGETYSKYISSDNDIEADIVISKADMIVFFVDAEEDSGRLVNHNLIVEKYESLLARLKAQHKIDERLSYVIVFTKMDKVVTDERRMRNMVNRKMQICAVFSRILGTDTEMVYEVDSTNFDNASLNDLFVKLIMPKGKTEKQINLDWVKAEIEKEK